ncbi:MAG: hypothetical protein PUH90_06415, partial [Clostridia bacterium]|nr:hypothetical protein [Clostridia bacterium]
ALSLIRWDISLSLNMTYFLSPIVGVADTSPEGGSEECLCERSEAISREGEFPQSMYFSLWLWDISLSLNMTYFI